MVALLVILALLLALTLNANDSMSAPLLAVADFILLGRPTDHSVTANAIADTSGEISFEHGNTSQFRAMNCGDVDGNGWSIPPMC